MENTKPPASQTFDQALVAALATRASALTAHHAEAFERFATNLFARLQAVRSTPLSPPLLATIAYDTFQHLAQFGAEERTISVQRLAPPPDVSGPGSARTFSVITAINIDKPFLVSTVVGELQARGIKTHILLHPVHVALRDDDGRLLDVAPKGGAADLADEAQTRQRVESVIVGVADELDPETSQEVAAALEDVLRDVDAAVTDWRPMVDRLEREVEALEQRSGVAPADLLGETIAFCRWLRNGQFVFLGLREYRLDGDPETGKLSVVPNSGLGILANPDIHVLRRGRELVALTDEIRRFYLKPSPIIITKSNVTSRVHRRVHMDYVGLKTYGGDGRLQGELRIVGLFTAGAYTELPSDIPFLRLKVEQVYKASGIARESHEGRMLQNILDTFPRDELIQIGVAQLTSWVPALLQLEFDPRVRVFARRDRFDRFVSVMVFVPRDRFSTQVRERIGHMLAEQFNGRMVAFQPFFTAGPLVRVSFIIGRYEGPTPEVPEAVIEDEIAAIIETWQDRLDKRLASVPGGLDDYSTAFTASYADTFTPERALEDIERIGRLRDDGPIAIDFFRHEANGPAEARVAIYRLDDPIPLSDRVPLLERLGFSVIDERTYQIRPTWNGARNTVCMHDMALRSSDGAPFDLERADVRLEDAFMAVFSGQAANDMFNRLVMAAGLDWREAHVLRSYAGYMRQIGLPFEQRYVAETLVRHPLRATDLIRLFKARFDPAIDADEADRQRVEDELVASFKAHLADVPSLDEDRILRTLVGLVTATTRTNFFQIGANGAQPSVLAFKIASGQVADAPEPRPFREIWVTGTEVDGVHLRFAPIARGGLRWSDRAQDFRTEVLGLAKAQQVKNTVIVPQGAKGGFFPKRLPEGGSRDDIMKAGISAYRLFVSTLLDLTDNLVDGKLVPPRDVVRRDGDDPYLVVAADKGTATFSDFANDISAGHGFWLDDAFASGGSAGYDHKKMAITARGAWECVKRHFREMNHDIQSQPFRVAGVGDMSGDVFGNGMLLSKAIKLVAAFDHRDIFIDPDPDPATSFAERERLFALPRSSWQDYNRELISRGGGIFPRSSKSIAVSPEMRASFGLEEESVTPNVLIRAILSSELDLMWFGGIGTYVRGDQETDGDVGDRANNAIRIRASELQVKVVGEGANLGMTQRARIDFASRGGRINTDFIDNSAGVNSSDQEVNIKIALAPVLASGRLDKPGRNALLVRMTDDVARACLDNNYWQSLAISLAERRGAGGVIDAQQLIQVLEQRGMLDRALEVLPDDVALQTRRAAGRGLTRPEISVLLSYGKLALSYDLIASSVPDDAAVAHCLPEYFPDALRRDYAADLDAHPLRREIITTSLTNRIVNVAGQDLPSRLAADWDLDIERVARSTLSAIDVIDARQLFAEISTLDNRISGELQLSLYASVQDLVRGRALWFAGEARQLGSIGETVARHRDTYVELAGAMREVATRAAVDRADAQRAGWTEAGVPEALADALAAAAALSESGDVALIAASKDGRPRNIRDAGRVYFELGEMLHLDELKLQGRDITANDRYDRLAINSALASLAVSQRAMVLAALHEAETAAEGLAAWRQRNAEALERCEKRLSAAITSGSVSVARLTVAASQVRELAELT